MNKIHRLLPSLAAGLCAMRNGAASAAMAMAALMAVGYAPLGDAQVSPSMVSLGVHTPKEVSQGTAQLLSHAAPDQRMHLVVGLQSPKLAEQEQFLKDVQTKGLPVFHKFMTAAEWNARFAPAPQDEQAVVDWAKSQGFTVSQRFPHRLVVDLDGTVSVVERALGLTINRYQLSAADGSTRTFYSAGRDPAVPAHLANIVHSIGGLNDLQVLHPASKTLSLPDFSKSIPGIGRSERPAAGVDGDGSRRPNAPAGAASAAAMTQRASAKVPAKALSVKPSITGGAYDPTDIYDSNAYDTNALYAQGHCCNPLHNPNVTPPETSIAIATAGTQDGNDFTGFHNTYPYLAWHYQQFYIDGTPACCDVEGTMDFEWATTMSNSFGSYQDTSMVYMYDGVNAQFSTFTDIYSHVLADGLARVFSSSWGCAEFDCTPQSVMDTDHAIFNAMAGQGWTLVGIAHDGGATASCTHHDSVSYPGSDPNVVSAGGTNLSLSFGPFFNYESTWTGGPSGCGSNDGGSGGGFSAYWPTPGYQNGMGYGSRAVPDVALNADWYYSPQNIYANGSLSGNGGTSIVAPELAGFFANANSYLLYLSSVISGGLCNGHACAPIGNADNMLYWFGNNPNYAAHYPYYDVLTGCNNNDTTAAYGLSYYCAHSGHDQTTGWGSFNMLQMAWAINTYQAGDFGPPAITFTSGPATQHWYNSDQAIAWTVADTTAYPGSLPPVGVAGFSLGWDADPGDVTSMATPGSGNSFYSGPQYVNSTAGCVSLAGGFGCVGGVSQGWHTLHVRAWDNSGTTSGDYTYGPIGYDTVAPQTTGRLSGTITPVTVTLSATDNASGVASTSYQLDGGAVQTYAGAFGVASLGLHTVVYHSVDVAGNVEGTGKLTWTEKAATTTTLVSSQNPVGYAGAVTFTASVKSVTPGAIAGSVTFRDGAATLATVALAAGKATYTTAALNAGTHSITASYAGSATYLPSTSAVLTQKVTPDATTNTLVSSLNPALRHATVTFTSTVKSTTLGAPTGNVVFKDGVTTLGTVALTAGKASFTTTALSAATHPITAVYGGSGNYFGSTSAILNQLVSRDPTTTALASSKNPSLLGNSVTFTATLSSATPGTIAGTVTFKNGATTLGTGTIAGGKATYMTAALPVGTHAITAAYGGSGDYLGSTSAVLNEVIAKDPTTTALASSKNPSIFGNSVTFTATLSSATPGAIAGTVTFKNGATTLGTGTIGSGKASYTTTALPAGADAITAAYSGSATYAASTSAALSQKVNKATSATVLTTSSNPSAVGAAVTFTAKVSSSTVPGPIGTVTFKDGATTLGTGTLTSSVAKLSTSALAARSHSITGVYSGTSNLSGSTSGVLTQVVH